MFVHCLAIVKVSGLFSKLMRLTKITMSSTILCLIKAQE